MPPVSPELQSALDRGALILAPTAYSAANLRATFDRQQRAKGLSTWQPANILSWQQWLNSLWTALILDGHESRLLLGPAQEELLWRELILPALDPANRTSAPAFASLARSAYALAASYQIIPRLAKEATTEDTAQFADWASSFARLCARHSCLSAAQLSTALAEHLDHRRLALPPELHLACFPHPDDLAPSDTALLEAIRRTRVRVLHHQPLPTAPVTRVVFHAATEAEELRSVARWLRDFLDDQLAISPELPSVHVVLASPAPDLAALDCIFREFLAPELNDVTTDASSAPWEFVAGRPLGNQPIVAALFRILQGLDRPLPVEDITNLLLSPCLGRIHDRDAAAQLDVRLRDRPPLRPELTFRELGRQIQSIRSAYEPSWLPPLLAFLRESGDLTASRSHAAWAAFIRELARAVAWPGAHPLTPIEFAAAEAFDHLLDSLATLDFTGRRVPFFEALSSLQHLLRSAVVSLPTRAAIQIVSAAEAAAWPADVTLLLQATDANWPPAVRPHPLLSWPLQASANMPGANPARDAARANRLTEALLNGPHILVSSAGQANDAPQRLAPSLARLAENAPWQAWTAEDLQPAITPLVTLEQITDDTPLPPLPSPHVTGGANVLRLQAACGFRAFAEIRLNSTELRSSGLGIDAARSGSILHNALDIFWTRLESQANLLALTDDACDTHLQTAVEQAFARAPGSLAAPEDVWEKAYRALQAERLYKLLRDWLQFERERAPFTVLAREQDREITIGPLHLQLRVDRMDAVGNDDAGSGTVLVDYKTGAAATPAAWNGTRPDEPQLPLYALLPQTAELRGLAFARIRAGQSAWAGLQSESGLLGKSKLQVDLSTLTDEWRETLTRLAEEFAAGDLSVHPKSYPETCAFCAQRLLCRLDTNALAEIENREEPVESEVEMHG